MADKSADQGRSAESRDQLRRLAKEGPLRGTDASERAAEMAADEDSPVAPGDSGGRNPGVHTVPPVMPAGAAANLTVDSTAASAGTQGGPQGAPAAAAIIAGEIAFGQDDVKTGWDVLTTDGAMIGTVSEVGPERILVGRTDREGLVYIPYSAVASVDKGKVHLSVPSGLVDQQDWQQVRPGGSSSGISPPSSGADVGSRSSGVGAPSSGPTEFAASHAATPEYAGQAEPVTTGRGVEEGPTQQPIRARAPGVWDPAPSPSPDAPRRPTGAPIPPQYEEPQREVPQHEGKGRMEPMRQAQDMMSNVRSTVQGAAQGQMTDSTPKDALADMFSFLENIPNSFYYLATVVSVMSSLVLFVTGKRWESLFVGLWAPTIVSASMFYKLLRPSHEVRQM